MANEQTPVQPASNVATNIAPPVEKTFTQDEVNKMLGDRAQRAADGARAQLLGSFKDFGVNSIDDLTGLVKAAREAQQAQMTELQKAQDRAKQLETQLAQAQADAASQAETARRVKVFRDIAVAPEYEDVLGVLLDRAKAESPQTFDEKAFLDDIKKKRPLLFGQTQAAATSPAAAPTPIGANTGVVFPQMPPASNGPAAQGQFDARTATPEALRQWEQQMGISGPMTGRF